MEALDGNAIGGLLLEVFGAEMTNATGVCAHCGAAGGRRPLVVYLQAPGTVVRCRSCDGVLVVIVDAGTKCVDLRGLASLEGELRLRGERLPPRRRAPRRRSQSGRGSGRARRCRRPLRSRVTTRPAANRRRESAWPSRAGRRRRESPTTRCRRRCRRGRDRVDKAGAALHAPIGVIATAATSIAAPRPSIPLRRLSCDAMAKDDVEHEQRGVGEGERTPSGSPSMRTSVSR